MTNMIEAAYEGSHAVRISGRLFDYSGDVARGGVLPRAARKLIKEGADPETLVSVSRDGTKVFKKDITLRAWARLTISEGKKEGLRVRRFRTHSSERNGARSRGEEAQEAPSESVLPAPTPRALEPV